MKREELLKWFTDDLLPKLVENGNFSEGEKGHKLEKCEFEEIPTATDSFASLPTFAKLTLKTPTGTRLVAVIVKFQCQNPTFRQNMRTVQQYHNEVTMYNEILPGFAEYLETCGYGCKILEDVIPKCYFASYGGGDPEKAIVILDDLRKYGYRVSDSVTDLDLNHCLVSLEKLARYHAVSYAMKFGNWMNWDKLKNSFVKVWYTDDPIMRQHAEDFKAHCAQRAIEYLLSKQDSEVPKDYLENFRKLVCPVFDLLLSLHSPKEPLSVICHGDFNRNNILYRYADDEVIDAKLTDFQTFLYGSPGLDLSFFMYMNTTLEFREKHFDEVFAHYHSTVIKTTAAIVKEEEEVIEKWLPLEAFREEFARVAIIGYIIVSFFLPVMMSPPQKDFENDVINKTPREMAEVNYVLGGEVVTKRIAEVIVDFYRRKFYV